MTQSRNLISPPGTVFHVASATAQSDAVGCLNMREIPWPRCKASSENG